LVRFFRRVLRLNDIHPTAKVSEQVNRKCRPRNTMIQLPTPYTDPESHNATLTDGHNLRLKSEERHFWRVSIHLAI